MAPFVPAGYCPIEEAFLELLEEWHGPELLALEDEARRALPEPTGDPLRDAMRLPALSADVEEKAKSIKEASLSRFRQLLHDGKLTAVYCTPTGASVIPADLWATSGTDGVIKTGDYFPFGRPGPGFQRVYVEKVFVVTADLEKVTAATSPEQPMDASGFLVRKKDPAQKEQTAPFVGETYTSPYILMMMEATRKFNITANSFPKQEELQSYFAGQKLPDGSPVSKRLARVMATLSRPPEAMKGGNKRVG